MSRVSIRSNSARASGAPGSEGAAKHHPAIRQLKERAKGISEARVRHHLQSLRAQPDRFSMTKPAPWTPKPGFWKPAPQVTDPAIATPAIKEEGAAAPKRPGDAWVVTNPFMMIGHAVKAPLGHTGLVTFSDAPGGTRRAKLQEYGAYDSDSLGIVREKEIPIDLHLDPKTGDLNEASRKELLSWLAKNYGDGGQRVEVTEVENIDLDKLDAFVDDFKAKSERGEHHYQIIGNNCVTFAWQAVHAGSVSKAERSELVDRGDWEGLKPRPNQGFFGKLNDIFDSWQALPAFSNDGLSDRFTQYVHEDPERAAGREAGSVIGALAGAKLGFELGAKVPLVGPLAGPLLGAVGGFAGWLFGSHFGSEAAR